MPARLFRVLNLIQKIDEARLRATNTAALRLAERRARAMRIVHRLAPQATFA